ncbi:MAG: EFR1 family ferrodoxin [Defluviitaleaceae bacterium]|nr:EFR1 family ferrodoxin [Defluviitaleaceae bacterium]MCL2836881.1 EFR1 family ferrodoxin [Defluviitaleaceae bacterium]
MLVLYFSGTGNTKYIAELFSAGMDAKCVSIEEAADFNAIIKTHDRIAVCYPVYGSRVPLIMREFIARHMTALKGKELVIFATQVLFSGDGARVLCDLFPEGHIKVIYAWHFLMPNNVNNFAPLRKTGSKSIQKRIKIAEIKMARVCRDINAGIERKRGFSALAKMLGKIQGIPWQGNSKNAFASGNTMENRAKKSVRIDADCTVCNICVECCPMRNLENRQGAIVHNNNCTVCYRCVNLCPQKAITVFLKSKPKWQYEGTAQHLNITR